MARAGLDRLSRQDAGYLRRETDAQPMQFVLLSYALPRADGSTVTLDEVRRHVLDRLDRAPQLHRRVKLPPLGIGEPVWIHDDRFNIEQQVVAWSFPGRDRAAAEAALARLTVQRLDTTRPLWRLHVGPVLEDGATPIAMPIHHALMDGGLLAQVLRDLFAPAPAAAPQPAAAPAAPPAATGGHHRRYLADGDHRRGSVGAWVSGHTLALRLLVAGVSEAVRHRLTRKAVAAPPPPVAGAPAAAGVLTGPVSGTRRVATLTWSLTELRALRRVTGATINDLFLSAAGAGLSAYLDDRGMRPEIPLLALVPRNVRTDDEARRTGNRTWSMLIPLPVGDQPDLGRLDAISAATGAAKDAGRSSGNAGLAYDVALSNVRLGGPHVVAGAPIAAHFTTAPLQGTNRLLAVALSYDDVFSVTFTADGEAVSDLEELAALTDAAFAGLQQAAGTKAVSHAGSAR